MPANLDSLPPEVIHMVASYLSFDDVASLRSVNHNIGTKATRGCFNKFFLRNKTIVLNRECLQQFISMTSTPTFALYLQNCTIVGVLHRNRDQRRAQPAKDEAHEVQQLLTQAFLNIRRFSQAAGISSLRITVAPGEIGPNQQDVYHSWRGAWYGAGRTFLITMAALHESRLPVTDTLDVFHSVVGCSLSTPVFSSLVREFSAGDLFTSLKSLKISLSAPPNLSWELSSAPGHDVSPFPRTGYQTQAWYSDNALRSVLRFLSSMPALKDLDVHWYDMGQNTSASVFRTEDPQASHDEVNPDPTTSLVLPEAASPHPLNKLALRGIFVSESGLLEFIRRFSPTELILGNVHLVSGTFRSTFTYMTAEDSPVEDYDLDDLYEGKKSDWWQLIHFEGVGCGWMKFDYAMAEELGPSYMTRRGVFKPYEIIYRKEDKLDVGSDLYREWARKRRAEFGPVASSRYDFVEANKPKDPW
ncbi:hypothetical protein F5Y13DRAFT_203027 [Hypoxylon sp. FL1857]|nr:hypothetical protein F5Y13DRAFT_203027 [Hypoxylon sp. FL1857]